MTARNQQSQSWKLNIRILNKGCFDMSLKVVNAD